MKRDSMGHILIAFCFLFFACKQPTSSPQTAFPEMPDWLDVNIDFEQLPNFKEPVELIFDVTVIGEDSALPLEWKGDTLVILYMRFSGSDWVVGLNDEAENIWQDTIELGQTFTLRPMFQMDSTLIPPPMYWINDSTLIPVDPDTGHITHADPAYGDTTRHFWSMISLRTNICSTDFPNRQNVDSLWSTNLTRKSYTLFFDYRTGDYEFPY